MICWSEEFCLNCISIDHIAVNFAPGVAFYKNWTAKMNRVLEPNIKVKGYDWEYLVDETEHLVVEGQWHVCAAIQEREGEEVGQVQSSF